MVEIDDTVFCGRCGSATAPDTCHCGVSVKDHTYEEGHSPVEMGCICGYDPPHYEEVSSNLRSLVSILYSRLDQTKDHKMEIRFTRITPEAKVPTRGSSKAAGLDLYASESASIEPGHTSVVSTGLLVAIPDGHEGQVRPRSGLAAKFGVTVLNAPGTIDSDYRGELKVILINHGQQPFLVSPGDRIAQLLLAPVTKAVPVLVDVLDSTDRGEGGFGSTGR